MYLYDGCMCVNICRCEGVDMCEGCEHVRVHVEGTWSVRDAYVSVCI